MGFSSPLYVLVLGILAKVFGAAHLVGVANGLGVLLFVAVTLVLVDLARRGFCSAPTLLIGWIAYIPIAAAGVSGMETMLFGVLFFGALLLLVTDRVDLALPVMALLVLTRLEGALFVLAVLGAFVALRRGKEKGRAADRPAGRGACQLFCVRD